MFGKKKEEPVGIVPVYTVDTIPGNYELVQTVTAHSTLNSKIIEEIGKAGAEVGADAVIGLRLFSRGASSEINAFGTAIKYVN